jgi:hypothetical protein
METKNTLPQPKLMDKNDFIKNALEKVTSKRVVYISTGILIFLLLPYLLRSVGNTIRALKDCGDAIKGV